MTLSGKAHERDIENALIKHVRDFLIELGQGFAYVGSQVPLNIDDQEFFIDLLFYIGAKTVIRTGKSLAKNQQVDNT